MKRFFFIFHRPTHFVCQKTFQLNFNQVFAVNAVFVMRNDEISVLCMYGNGFYLSLVLYNSERHQH